MAARRSEMVKYPGRYIAKYRLEFLRIRKGPGSDGESRPECEIANKEVSLEKVFGKTRDWHNSLGSQIPRQHMIQDHRDA